MPNDSVKSEGTSVHQFSERRQVRWGLLRLFGGDLSKDKVHGNDNSTLVLKEGFD